MPEIYASERQPDENKRLVEEIIANTGSVDIDSPHIDVRGLRNKFYPDWFQWWSRLEGLEVKPDDPFPHHRVVCISSDQVRAAAAVRVSCLDVELVLES